VASGLAKLAASFLKYGWIPCMLIMYAFPPVSVKIEPRTLRSSQNHDPQLSAKLNLPKLDSLKDMIVSAISSATSEEEKDSLKLKYGKKQHFPVNIYNKYNRSHLTEFFR
jgi:hypothetical protein